MTIFQKTHIFSMDFNIFIFILQTSKKRYNTPRSTIYKRGDDSLKNNWKEKFFLEGAEYVCH